MRFPLRQKVVYWPPNPPDGYGRPTTGTPVQYPARWEDGSDETISSDGDLVYSSASVFLANNVLTGGLLYLGLLTDLQASSWLANPKSNPGVHEILSVTRVPSIRNTQTLYKAMLK